MNEMWILGLMALMVGFLLGAAIAYGLLNRRTDRIVHAQALAQQQTEHDFELRQASLAQELQQLKQLYEQLLQAKATQQEESLHVQQELNLARQDLAGLREKNSYFNDLQQQLQQTEQQLNLSEQQFTELKTRLEQERKHFSEQLLLLQNAKIDLSREFENIANKIFESKQQQFNLSSKNLLDSTLDPLRTQLTEFRKKVEDVYDKENAERNRLSGQVIELQKQAQKIGEDAVNLAQALKGNTKAQGNWGEVILERLLEESGLQKGREYETQVRFVSADGSRSVPDVIIHLPEQKDIVIDAKCSLVDYEKYCSSDDDVLRKQYLSAHVGSLRNHIKSLSIKEYEKLEGIRSLDFVFIFIPIEAAFLVALQHEPGLYREAYENHIILVSPTTLLATLRTVDNIWRREKQSKNAERIAKEAGLLHDQFVLLLESLDNIGNYLGKTQEAYNKARDKLQNGRGNLIKKVNDIRRLGAKTKKSIGSHYLDDDHSDEAVNNVVDDAVDDGLLLAEDSEDNP